MALCTLQRPHMLEACLRSLAAQELPEGWILFVALAENAPGPGCAAVVEKIRREHGLTIVHECEPRRGIPFARNRTLEIALREKADWIAFIDDDETAEPGWLRAFCEATGRIDAEIFMGRTWRRYPEGTPDWYPRMNGVSRRTGTIVTDVFTCNSFIRSDLVAADGLGLRFDEKMRDCGGSDADFFSRARAKGKVAVFVAEAEVTEDVPEERARPGWQLRRDVTRTGSWYYTQSKHEPPAKVALRLLWRALRFTVRGCVLLLPVPVLVLTRPKRGRKRGYQALSAFAHAAGLVIGLFGPRLKPYKDITGS